MMRTVSCCGECACSSARSMPVIASLDFHANVSPLDGASRRARCVAYRTYPHVDMAATGSTRDALLCMTCDAAPSARGPAPVAVSHSPHLAMHAGRALAQSCCSSCDAANVRRCISLNFTPGFPAADVAECGPAVFGYGTDADAAGTQRRGDRRSCRRTRAATSRSRFIPSRRRCAKWHAAPPCRGRPIMLADTQDNPGGGGTADTTSLLKALIAQAHDAVLAGVICDPEAAARAHAAGVGAHDRARRSVRSPAIRRDAASRHASRSSPWAMASSPAPVPSIWARAWISGRWRCCGSVTCTSPSPAANNRPPIRRCFALGRRAREFAVLALKSSVHFRADFGAIASRILVVDAPGANIADPARLPFTQAARPECGLLPGGRDRIIAPSDGST